MTSTTLSDGRIKYTTDGWIGFRKPTEPMTKTKWYKNGVKYWEVKGSKNTYVVSCDERNLLKCECLGFTYRRNCKHIKEIVSKIRKNSDEV